MAQKTAQWLNAPILYLDTIDSTNNYAMHLIDADKAQPGITILTKAQLKGKGQRGKSWADKPGESLLMSLIAAPQHTLEQQFVFSAAITNAIVKELEALHNNWHIHIKWPNDIIINDKKAGGILIENILRGSKWLYAVIGFGLNVLQERFDDDLPVATSLKIASGRDFNPEELMHIIRHAMIETLTDPEDAAGTMNTYNKWLYRKNEWQSFEHPDGTVAQYRLAQVTANGRLEATDSEGKLQYFNHGDLTWKW